MNPREAVSSERNMPPIQPEACDVVILCGGLGTRLRAVVADRPKPMAAIDGVPFLCLLVEHLASFGFRRFVLCVGHKSEVIESHFHAGSGNLSVVLSREESPLGTGGALWHAREKIQGRTFVALNGDSFCPVDYPAFLEFHASRSATATITVTPVKDAAEYGTVNVSNRDRVLSFAEKSGLRQEGLVNAGVYAFETRVLEEVDRPTPFSVERDIFPHLAETGTLSAWKSDGPLLDIGTAERYRDAQSRLAPLMQGHADTKGPD